MKEVVEASIAAGTLKLAGVKRRSKSERIANKAKAFKFGKDGAGSSADKAWDVDEGIAFEIALQHKSRENNSLKTVQKENENFMASLQLENAHLKQTYKDLFESVQRSKVEIKQCDEVKVKDDFDEIETKNIELEHRVSSLLKENEHLKLVYKNLFDSIKKTRVHKENLRATLSEFSVNHICGKEDSSPSSTNELEKESGENTCDNAKSEFQTKFIELEKVLTQQTKDFDDVKLELSNRTAKFEAYFEKLEKMKVVLERQLARKVDDSKAEKDQFLKEINHLRTQLENLKGKSVQTKGKRSVLAEYFDRAQQLGGRNVNSKIHFRNSDKTKNFLKSSSFMTSKSSRHEEDVSSCKKSSSRGWLEALKDKSRWIRGKE
ncbi:hypothetical protein Tco_0316145 [Tanacetum coccineum]